MRLTATFLLLLLSYFALGQDYYLIHLKPKLNTALYLSDPLQMLSQRALDRRTNKQVMLDDKDVPIDTQLIQQIKNLDLTYVGASKWLNAVMVEISNEATISQISHLPFVLSVENLVRNENPRQVLARNHSSKFLESTLDYGSSSVFIEQMHLGPLHQAGYTGQNILIGVIDSGFPGVNTINAFSALRHENRIVDTKNFVNNNSIYQMHSHGTNVLATMAAKINNQYIGSAPDAQYALYVSEDAPVETPKELLYWVQAAERADSVGVDLINTSLGYTTFDDPRYDFTYDDMNGETTIISKGAQIAASRGIFLVNAMGNDGNNSWHYLGAPADAVDVFSIGALDANLNPAWFTSYGPNANQIQKPNVSALGVQSPTFSPSGNMTAANGTSFASPILAGAVASLMSALPNASNQEIKTWVETSAHLYPSYDVQLGYGVPNFETILGQLNNQEISSLDIQLYPNPATYFFKVQSNQSVERIEVLDWSGQRIKVNSNTNEMNVEDLSKGLYFVRVYINNKAYNYKLMIK